MTFRGGGGGRLLGEVWLPVTKVHATAERASRAASESAFSEVLWLHGQRIGRLEGRVRLTNGPKVVQLPGGFYTEVGILPIGPIAAGKSSSSLPGGGGGAAASLATSPGPPLPTPANVTNSLNDFEQPPKGLKLPKEVELLVSLVQSLRKVQIGRAHV